MLYYIWYVILYIIYDILCMIYYILYMIYYIWYIIWYIIWYNIMCLLVSSYKRSAVDRNVVRRRMTVLSQRHSVSSIAVRSSNLTPCRSMARRHNHISGVLNAGRTSAPSASALSALINPVSSPVRIISSRLLAFHQHVLRSLLCLLFHLWPSTVMPFSLVA